MKKEIFIAVEFVDEKSGEYLRMVPMKELPRTFIIRLITALIEGRAEFINTNIAKGDEGYDSLFDFITVGELPEPNDIDFLFNNTDEVLIKYGDSWFMPVYKS